jgi:hypothetical protein
MVIIIIDLTTVARIVAVLWITVQQYNTLNPKEWE